MTYTSLISDMLFIPFNPNHPIGWYIHPYQSPRTLRESILDARICSNGICHHRYVHRCTLSLRFLFSVLMRLFYNNLLCLGSLVLLESADAVHAGRDVRLNLGWRLSGWHMIRQDCSTKGWYNYEVRALIVTITEVHIDSWTTIYYCRTQLHGRRSRLYLLNGTC